MSNGVQAIIIILVALVLLGLARAWQLKIYRDKNLGRPRWFGFGRDKDPE